MMGAIREQPARLEGSSDGSPHKWQNPLSKFPGWTTRIRVGSALPDRTPCPSIGTLEKSTRGFTENLTENFIRPALGTSSDFLSKACDFYNLLQEKRAECHR